MLAVKSRGQIIALGLRGGNTRFSFWLDVLPCHGVEPF